MRASGGAGKSCAPGGSAADDGAVVLCRVKFTERLPFVIRQDADVAVHNQSIRLIMPASRWSRLSIAPIRVALEVEQVRGLGRRIGGLCQAAAAGSRRSDDLLERLILQANVQLEFRLAIS